MVNYPMVDRLATPIRDCLSYKKKYVADLLRKNQEGDL